MQSGSGDAAATGESVEPTAAEPADIDPRLQEADGTVEVVVRLTEAGTSISTDRETTIETLRDQALETQTEVVRFSQQQDGIEVLNRFWITNAVLLRVDTDAVDLESIAVLESVEELHANFEVSVPEPVDRSAVEERPDASSHGSATYGLDQINATDAWDEYDARGEGVKVAVLDTGVEPDHPDVDLYTDDPSDPTYPGGWAEFDQFGQRNHTSTPHDTGYHGTHVSGTVAGGNTSGTHIGVAPNADLMHGLVLQGGTGSFAQIAAGMEWAVEEDANVVSMSLSATGYWPQMIDPVRNAHDAGTLVVGATGNDPLNGGEGSSGSPANVYEAVGVGAVDEDGAVPFFSMGKEIDTDDDWGDFAPFSWPDTYVVPDVTGPGVNVTSAIPDDTAVTDGAGNVICPEEAEYCDLAGTSMATPHVSGAVALAISASSDRDPATIADVLRETAWKPEECSPECDRDGADNRYGQGIVDAKAVTDELVLDDGVTGTVTDESGEPVGEVAVEVRSEKWRTRTDADGEYTLHAEPGDYTLEYDAFGHETTTEEVSVGVGFTSQNVTLATELDAQLDRPQPRAVKGGENVTARVHVANAESLTVELDGDYDAADATLYVDGEQRAFNETVRFESPRTDRIPILVETTDATSGDLGLVHTVTGNDESLTVETGPTVVVEEFTQVAVVAAESDGNFGPAEDTAFSLERDLPATFEVSLVPSTDALNHTDEFEAFLVHSFAEDVTDEEIREFVDATESPRTGVVYYDYPANQVNAIERLSRATGDPKSVDYLNAIDFQNTYAVKYYIRDEHEDHPILSEFGGFYGEYIVNANLGGTHDWFEGFDGTVLADVGTDESGVGGSGLAIDEKSQTVLAASLGVGTFGPTFSEDGDQTRANAVEYVSSAPAVLAIEEVQRHVVPGESISTTLSVEALSEATIDLDESATIDADETTLYVDGVEAEWGSTHTYDDLTTDEFNITVETTANASGAVALDASFVAGEENETHDLLVGPTAVYDPPIVIGEDADTVQGGVDLASPGADVVLGEGAYDESVTVDVPNVTIVGDGVDDTTLTAPDGADAALTVTADDVTVRNLSADGTAAGDGVVIDDASDVTVEGVVAAGDGTGVTATRATDATIDSVTASGETGVLVEFADGVRIEDSDVAGSVKGVEAFFSDDATIVGNAIADATYGIDATSGDSHRVEANAIENVTDGVYAVVRDSEFVANEIEAAETGIHVNNRDGNALTRNEIGADRGVYIESVAPGDIEVRYNDLEHTEVAVESEVGLFTDYDVHDLRLNYYGERGPTDVAFDGNATVDPFLTEHPSEIDDEEVTAFGTALTMEAGDLYAFGVPGPAQGTVSDVFDADFEGVLYGFDDEEQRWIQLYGDSELSALDAVLVVAESDGRAVVTFDAPSDSIPAPSQQKLTEGWNFVAAPEYAPVDEAFGYTSADPLIVTPYFEQPGDQVGPAGELERSYRFDESNGSSVSAFTGYFVFASEDGYIPAYLDESPTLEEFYEALGIEQNEGAESGESVDAETVRERVEQFLAEEFGADDATRETAIETAAETIRTSNATTTEELVDEIEAAIADELGDDAADSVDGAADAPTPSPVAPA